jgi:hypothetical protein
MAARFRAPGVPENENLRLTENLAVTTKLIPTPFWNRSSRLHSCIESTLLRFVPLTNSLAKFHLGLAIPTRDRCFARIRALPPLDWR